MDGLSVAASIVGLVTAAAQMTTLLYSISHELKEAPGLAQAAANELKDISMVLNQLQRYLDGQAIATKQRFSLITVEHITATLTGCVLTYSELDGLLKSIHVDTGLRKWDRAVWYLKKDQVYLLVTRLQSHKSSLGLMLNILQCVSQREAESSMDRLCEMVAQLLQSNRELSDRLRNLEDGFVRLPSAAQGLLQTPLGFGTATEAEEPRKDASGEGNTVSEERRLLDSSHKVQMMDSSKTADGRLKISAFEEILYNSRVYRHVGATHSDSSLPLDDDGRSTLAFSIYSSLTLGDVSNISVYAIPVYARDLSNFDCYIFDRKLNRQVGSRVPRALLSGSLAQDTFTMAGTGHRYATNSMAKDSTRTTSPLSLWWKGLGRSHQKQPRPEHVQHGQNTRVFGVPLVTSLLYAATPIWLRSEQKEEEDDVYGFIPVVVAKCGIFLKEEGPSVPNVMSTSSPPTSIQALQEAFDSPPSFGSELSWAKYTVFDCANILLRYILQLPEPVIPLESCDSFRIPLEGYQREAVGATRGDPPRTVETGFDVQKTIRTYQTLITALPPVNRILLLYLLDLVTIFATNSDVHKMTTPPLATVLQAGILAHPRHENVWMEIWMSQNVLIFLIENQDNFLIGAEQTSSDASAAAS